MLTNNALANNDNLLSQSLQRLSTGLKINSAKDNPAGMAMAKRMNAQLESLSVANNNASDGVSIMEIADGARESPIQMIMGPVTTGGRYLITFFIPISLIIKARIRYSTPATTIPPQA